MNFINNFVIFLLDLLDKIIILLTQLLGNPIIPDYGRRIDFQINNPKQLKLKCSYYQIINKNISNNRSSHKYCVIYLHSLNGSRLESIRFAPLLLKNDICFANLDLSGSGISQGEYVSLGYHQKNDVIALIQQLYKRYGIDKFSLWGRSMGAVTALKVAQLYSDMKKKKAVSQWSLVSLVLDSPFSSLNRLAVQIASKRINLPSFFIRAGLLIIKNSIEQKAKFRIEDLEILNHIGQIKIPLMILTSKQDQVINYKHSEDIYQKYTYPQKELFFIKGNHNEARQQSDIQKIFKFFRKTLENKTRSKSGMAHFKSNQQQFLIQLKKSSNTLKNSQNPSKMFTTTKIQSQSKTPNHSPIKKITQTKLKLVTNDVSNQNHIQSSLNFKPMMQIRKKLQKITYTTNQVLQQKQPQIKDKVQTQQNHLNIINAKLQNMKKNKNQNVKKSKTEQTNYFSSDNNNKTIYKSYLHEEGNKIQIRDFHRSDKNILKNILIPKRSQIQQNNNSIQKQSFRNITITKQLSHHAKNPSIIKCTKKPNLNNEYDKKYDSVINKQSPIKQPRHGTINLKNNSIIRLKQSIKKQFEYKN